MIAAKFHGTNNFFWIGCVEERDDSKHEDGLKLGRVQVRVLGFHSETKTESNETGEGIPTKNLIWAYPISPITSANMSGIGQSPLGVVEGTWVVGMSMDGAAMQDLYIMGTLPGVPQERLNPQDQGFCDPNDKYPLDEYMGESDLHRLVRNESLTDTILQDKKEAVELAITTANGHSWSEPQPPYAAEYPFNHVRSSESGHIEEWDDTEGAERLHKYHKSGTFKEIHPEGDQVTKIVGKDYEIVHKDKNLFVKGDLNITVNGDARILAKKNIYMQASKNIDMKAGGQINMYASRGINMITPRKVSIIGTFGITLAASMGAIKASATKGVSISSKTNNISISGFKGVSMTSSAGTARMFGSLGASVAAVAGPATVASPVNTGGSIARAVG